MSGPLARDLTGLTLMAGLFALPVLQSRNLLPHDLIRFITSAITLVVGATGVVVVSGGLVLAGEKAYRRWSEWWRTQQGRGEGGAEGEQ